MAMTHASESLVARRSLSEVRAFLEGLTGSAEATALKEFAEEFLKFVQGNIKDDTMEKRLRNLLAHEPQSAPVSVAEPEATVTPPEPDRTPPVPLPEPAQAMSWRAAGTSPRRAGLTPSGRAGINDVTSA